MYQRTADDDRLRPRPPNHFADYAALLSPLRYKELVSESRAQSVKGTLSALIDNKAGYVAASDFRPRFLGTDATYGAEAMAKLEEALKICNLRGSRFDWRASWKLCTRNFADSGGFFVLLTTWEGTNQPALQFLESHRIGQREWGPCIVGPDDASTTIVSEDGKESVVKGAYVGLPIDNGVITTPWGTEVAFRVLGTTKEEDVDISARDLIYVAAPKSYSECRPAPDIAPSLLDFLALELAQTCQLDQQIADARLTFIESNVTGMPTPAAARMSGNKTTTNGTPTEVYERGGQRFIKSGNSLVAHEANRPSDQWQSYDKRVLSRAAAALKWRAEMLSPEDLRGAATRAFQDQINTLIRDDFVAVVPAITRCIKYFIAKMTQNGDLPKNAEWMKWGVASPPWFEVDRASARIDLEEVAAGRVSMSALHQRDGVTTAEVFSARAHDYKLAEQVANDTGVPIEIIRGDNGVTASRTPQVPAETTPPDPNKKP